MLFTKIKVTFNHINNRQIMNFFSLAQQHFYQQEEFPCNAKTKSKLATTNDLYRTDCS